MYILEKKILRIFENFSPRQVYILEFYILSEFAFLGETLINQNHQNHENSRKQVRCQSERTSKNYAKIRKFKFQNINKKFSWIDPSF